MMTAHQRWTQSQITELRQRVQQGDTLADIVEALQRPAEDIAAMTARLRLKLAPTAAPALTY